MGEMVVRYDNQERRLWLLGQRSHHGAWGVGLILLGLWLCLHDRGDMRAWFQLGSQL